MVFYEIEIINKNINSFLLIIILKMNISLLLLGKYITYYYKIYEYEREILLVMNIKRISNIDWEIYLSHSKK